MWETTEEVYHNLIHFKEWLPRSQWAHKEKAQIYLLYNCLPTNLKKKLLNIHPKTETALSVLYGGELKQGPHLEGLDERAIKDHLYHCRNVFNENKGCDRTDRCGNPPEAGQPMSARSWMEYSPCESINKVMAALKPSIW